MKQVCLEKARIKDIPYDVEVEHVILFLKGLLDSGASNNLLSKDDVGALVIEPGFRTQVHRILDENRSFSARQISGCSLGPDY